MGGQSHWWNKGGNAWYLHHFWEHYAFSNDTEYLRKAVHPMLKEICEYWEDHLQPLPDGRLIVPDMRYSPEHGPFDVDGCSYCQELVWDLFTNYLDACDTLGVDKEYRAKVASMRAKLLVPGIGSWGQLLEWMTEMKDFAPRSEREKKENASEGHIDSPENGHRHSSHLLAVYPLRQISYEQTPKLAAAAKVSVIARSKGKGSIGISFVHRTAIFARLYEPELAYGEIHKFYKEATPNFMSRALYDAEPALPGVMAEMLLQSQQKELHILPALPKAWPTGNVKGLRARGGFEVDESWKDGRLGSVTIRSIAGRAAVVRYGDKTIRVDLPPGTMVTLDADLKIEK
jgi:alpha-L-fucosidase 2